MAHVIGIRREDLAEYVRLHSDAWPEVHVGLEAANIRNYSIYLVEPDLRLFSYWEYHGDDLQADLEQMLSLPRMAEWTAICAPMHAPCEWRQSGEWWARIPEIFHGRSASSTTLDLQ